MFIFISQRLAHTAVTTCLSEQDPATVRNGSTGKQGRGRHSRANQGSDAEDAVGKESTGPVTAEGECRDTEAKKP